MFVVLQQDQQQATIQCDARTLTLFKDLYDTHPLFYPDLDLDLDPQEIVDFIDSLDTTHDRTMAKIHWKVKI